MSPKRTKPPFQNGEPEAERPIIPLPREAVVDVDLELAAEMRKRRTVDEAYEQFVQSGGLDLLPGKGKPLVVPTGDIMETILRQANVVPPWILLGREIRDLLEQAAGKLRQGAEDAEIDELLHSANEQIAHMNSRAPGLSLHRKKVTRDTLLRELERWPRR